MKDIKDKSATTGENTSVEAGFTPAGVTLQNPMTLSDTDRQIRQAVDAAADEPLRIESVTELKNRVWMQVPEVFQKQYPERAYKWLSINGLQSDLMSGNGVWKLVNRGNHSRIPDSHFDMANGGVIYAGQNILAYTWRSNTELMEEKTIADFAAGEKDMRAKFNQTYHGPDGKPAVVMEEIGNPGKMTPGTTQIPMTQDSDYDFGATT